MSEKISGHPVGRHFGTICAILALFALWRQMGVDDFT